MIDKSGEYVPEQYAERPIILSPPPVDPANSGSFSGVPPELPHNYQAQRNQSVGYNLQQEFEALKADLDLDLSFSNLAADPAPPSNADAHDQPSSSSSEGTHSVGNGSRVFSGGTGPSLLAPAANSPAPYHSQNVGGAGGLSSLLMSKNPGFSSLGSVPVRPQSVNDYSSVLPRSGAFGRAQPFHSEMLHTAHWLESLSPQDLASTIDYWCAHLPFDVLQAMKTRMNGHVPQGMAQGLRAPQVFGGSEYAQYSADYIPDMEVLSLADPDRTLQQPKPKANGTFKSHLFADSKVQRPKSADPSLHNRAPGSQGPHISGLFGERTQSPTSHLYEKTSFLQHAAASNSPHAYTQSQPHLAQGQDDSFDHSAANKLGALATINSRVALDFNRKLFSPQGQTRTPNLGHGPGHAVLYEESLNRQGNSASVPVNPQRYSAVAASKLSAPLTPVSSAGSSMPSEIVDQDLLDNIPAWLKLLRLHKYTDSLKDMRWQDLVELSDDDLENKGVKALGARRKLLKAFETVKLSKA